MKSYLITNGRPPSSFSQIQRTATAVVTRHEGPLPPAKLLAEYNNIVPGAAERIIAMAEQQIIHRHNLEKKVIDSDIRNSRLGLHYGLIIGLASVLGGAMCIYFGHDIAGSILGGTGLTGLVGVFVYGSNQRKKERETRLNKQIEQ